MSMSDLSDVAKSIPIDVSRHLVMGLVHSMRLQDEPLHYISEEIVSLYSGIHDGISSFEQSQKNRAKSADYRWFKDFSIDNLATIEGQTSWHVLRQIQDDSQIRQYSRNQRLAKFIEELYTNPDKYVFFNIRKNALKRLGDHKIILVQNYEPKV